MIQKEEPTPDGNKDAKMVKNINQANNEFTPGYGPENDIEISK